MSYNSGVSWEQFETTKNNWINKLEIRSGKLYALCKARILLIANINALQPNPLAQFTINQLQACGSTTLQLQNNSSNFYTNYQWFFNNTLVSTNYSYTQTYTVVSGNTDNIKLVVTNNGKTDTISKNNVVLLKKRAIANLGNDVYECYGQQITLNNIGAPSGQTHTWTPGYIFSSTSGTTALTTPITNNQQIILYTNNSDNCPKSDTVDVYVTADIEEVFHKTCPTTTDNCSNAPCNSITGIDFVNEKIGYAFAMSGEVLKTTDGANTWTTSLVGPTYGAYFESGIDFIDANIGYVPGVAKKTVDGGLTWINLNMGNAGSKVHFLNKDTGIVSVKGSNTNEAKGWLYLTLNGGVSFTQVYNYATHGDFYFHDIKILDANTYIIAGGAFGSSSNSVVLKKTTNAGATWSVIPSPTTIYISDMAVFGTDTILAVDGVNYVHKTTNGGATWNKYLLFIYPSNISSAMATSIEMINSQTGYASGNNGQVFKTTNGGQCWQKVYDAQQFDQIFCISIPPTKNAVFFGGEEVLGDEKPEIFATQYYRDFRVILDTNWCVGNKINTHNYSTGYTSYKWYLNNSLYASKRDTNFNFSTTGTYLIRLDADSMGLYTISKTFTININPALGSIGPIFGNPYVCTMTTNYAQFSASTNTAITHYYWTSSNPNFMLIYNTETDSVVHPLIQPNNSFTQILQLSVYGINAHGCFTSDTTVLNIQTQKNIPTATPSNITFNKNCVVFDTVFYDTNFNPIVYDTLTVATNTVNGVSEYSFNMPGVFYQNSIKNSSKIPVYYNGYSCPYDSLQIEIGLGNSCGYSSNTKSRYVKWGLQHYNFNSTPDTVVLQNSTVDLWANLSLGLQLDQNCNQQPYNWYLNNQYLTTEYYGLYSIFAVTAADTGYYSIRVKTGCDTVKKTFHVKFPVTTNVTNSIGPSISIFPNPSNEAFTINNPRQMQLDYELYNYLGQKVISLSSHNPQQIIDTKALANGSYFLKITLNGESEYRKLMIQH